MKHVSIIVPQGPIILSSVIGTYKVFTFVNHYLHSMGKAPFFDVHLVGLGSENQLYGGLFSIRPDRMMEDVSKTDLILIPAFSGDIGEALKANQDFAPWITAHINVAPK